MKKSEKQEVVEERLSEPVATTETAAEPQYTFAELVESHKSMGYSVECVVAALRHKGVRTATFAEAKKIVDQFMRKVI